MTTTPRTDAKSSSDPTASNQGEAKELDWSDLISAVLARRDDPRSAGYTAAVRAASVAATQNQALAYTEAYLSGLNDAQRRGARRAAGICASFRLARQPRRLDDGKSPRRPIGSSLRDLYVRIERKDPSTLSAGGVSQNALLNQVNSLPLLDVEQAANVLGLLVGRCADQAITVDYYDLARTLIYWGHGATMRSRQSRERVLTAFYSSGR